MRTPDTDKVFSGSIAAIYDAYLVPLIFQPYADDIAQRLVSYGPARVLEIAAGTGSVTRALASALPGASTIVATDLNQAMLDQASARGAARPVEWRQADVMQLPFADGAFDAVVCQFGVMFFPDKGRAFAEMRRVLAPNGVLLFNVWDSLRDNEIPQAVDTAVASIFPDNPPHFLARTPHGYSDPAIVASDLARGGFESAPSTVTVAARSVAPSARDAAVALCQGTPLRSEIEAQGAGALDEATNAAETEIARRFGNGAVDGKIQAHVVAIRRT